MSSLISFFFLSSCVIFKKEEGQVSVRLGTGEHRGSGAKGTARSRQRAHAGRVAPLGTSCVCVCVRVSVNVDVECQHGPRTCAVSKDRRLQSPAAPCSMAPAQVKRAPRGGRYQPAGLRRAWGSRRLCSRPASGSRASPGHSPRPRKPTHGVCL